MDLAEYDERLNNILASGAVFMALHMQPGIDAEVVVDTVGNATNEIMISMEFLKSKYRVTVERIPGSEE